MNEMLGNQYFMARKFIEAERAYEFHLRTHELTDNILKKLIICYSQTDQLEKSWNNFLILTKRNIATIIETDPIKDDCPCPEIIAHIESSTKTESHSDTTLLTLAMLTLYTSIDKSKAYFAKLMHNDKYKDDIAEVLIRIKQYQNLNKQYQIRALFKHKNIYTTTNQKNGV